MKVKLLYLISRLDIGGMERELLTLVSNLDREEFKIDIVYFEGDGYLKNRFEALGCRVKRLKILGFWDLAIYPKLYNHVKKNKYHIIHTHSLKADFWGAIVGRLAKTPFIISTIHNEERYLKNPIVKLLERWVVGRIDDVIIAISNGVKRFLIDVGGIPEDKIRKVHYGLDPSDIEIDKNSDIREEFGIDEGAPLIGCVGRLIEQKGHEYLIRAAVKVIENFPKAKFLIVGKGNLEKELKGLVKDLGLNSNIIFTGFRDDIYSIIDKLDLVVMPSLWEGFGLVLLEAMAMGKPIVATRVGGIQEAVENGVTGTMVPPADSGALSDAIIDLLKKPYLLHKMGEAGRKNLEERFGIKRMTEEMEGVYEALLTARAKRKIKVLQIIESTGKSGPRYVLSNLMDNLNKDRFDLSLICSTLRDNSFYEDIERMRERGVKVVILEMRREISPFSDLAAFFKLCRYIKKGDYDIIHTHNSKAGFLGRLAAKLIGVPVVIHTPHCLAFMNEGFTVFGKLFYLYLEKFAGIFTDRLIAVSESQRIDFIKRGLIDPDKVITIQNGVDINRFNQNGIDCQKKREELGVDDGSVILGAVGVLNMSKGHKYLIEATANVIRNGFDVRLIIAGEGYLEKELEDLAHALKISSRVKFLGFRRDIPEVLSIVDIFILPSLWEGMSLALLEAMASGIPAVSTDVHGAIDVIRDNRTGILVQRKDARGLSGAIEYLISHRGGAKEMGEEAKRFIIKDYTLNEQIRKMEELYVGMSNRRNPLTYI